MRLVDLKPSFLIHVDELLYKRTDNFFEADGLTFLCPKCFIKNNGEIGTHSMICWTPKISQTTSPNPGRWNFEGTSYEDLSLIAGSSSIAITGGCQAHFFIKKGEVILV